LANATFGSLPYVVVILDVNIPRSAKLVSRTEGVLSSCFLEDVENLYLLFDIALASLTYRYEIEDDKDVDLPLSR